MPLGQQLAPHLPFLRRYARALTGSQSHGDHYVRATLEAIVAAPDQFPAGVDPRLGLYRMFQAIWQSANADGFDSIEPDTHDSEAIARARQRAARNAQVASAEHCAECDDPIPEARRCAIPGVQLCVACQSGRDSARTPLTAINRRASKDSQLK